MAEKRYVITIDGVTESPPPEDASTASPSPENVPEQEPPCAVLNPSGKGSRITITHEYLPLEVIVQP